MNQEEVLNKKSMYEKAKVFAILAHTSIGHVRKFDNSPYQTHVLRVAELVSTKTQDQEVLAAACLHDVLEDVEPNNPDFSRERILEEFGQRVLGLVLELTDVYTKENHPDKNRKTRKELEAQRLARVSEEAKLIKRADIYDNHQSIMGTSFEEVWLQEKFTLDELIGVWDQMKEF
jgi:(p)ppGpp synthase/HD superfamily hydrolase